MSRTTRPTAEYLLRRKEEQRVFYADRNKKIAGIRELRLGTNTVPVPEKMQASVTAAGGPYHAPHIKFTIRATQGLLGARLPRAKRCPADVTKDEPKRTASRIEKWFNLGFYPQVMRRVLFQMTDSMAEGGWGVWKLRYATHAWGEALKDADEDDAAAVFNKKVEQTRRDHLPWAAEHVATQTFYPDFEDDELVEVFEITWRTRGALYGKYGTELKRAGVVIDENAQAGGERIECLEHWNGAYFSLMVEDKLIKQGKFKSRRKRPPYYFALFSPTGIHDPALLTETISDPIIELQKRLERWLTLKDYWAEKIAFPPFKLTPLNPDDIQVEDTKRVIEWEGGETTEPPAGYGWDVMSFPGTGADLNQMWQYLAQAIDDHSLAPVLLGKNTGRISTATQQGQIQLAKNILSMATDEIAAGFDEMAADVLWLIDNDLHADVPVQIKTSGEWLKIGPADIDGDYHVTHMLKPVLKMESIIDAQWLQSGLDHELLTETYVQEHGYDIEDPEEMQDAVMVEKLVKSPQSSELIWAMVMKDLQADQEPPAPTAEELVGMQAPGMGTPEATAGGMGGIGMPMNPGDQRPLIPTPPPAGVA